VDIEIWTDGGCHGNPGPGAWAYLIASGEGAEERRVIAERTGAEKLTTNNRMELRAVISSLEDLDNVLKAAGGNPKNITVFTDSEYVKSGITKWMLNWKANGWRTAAKKPVKNQDLWTRLDSLCASRPLLWRWVNGHSGIIFNERCDALVQKAISELE
jgi:ribonuclease HI